MKVRFVACVAAAVLLGGAARGQEPAEEAGVTAPAETTETVLAGLDVITVFATRNPVAAFDYPGQVSVIGRDRIEDFNPSTVSDLFDAVPGAFFEGGPRRSGESPVIRGLTGEGVLVLLDGARQSFVSGHDGRFFIDPDLLQAVEVVRGPGSALYGSGALGGVIALRTVTADDILAPDERAAVRIGGGFQGVNSEWRGAVTGAWRSAGGAADLVAHIGWRKSGDIELGSGLALPAGDEILSSLLKATARPAPGLTVSASWIHYGGDSIDPNNPQGAALPGPDNGEVFRDIDSDTVQGTVKFAPAGSSWVDAGLAVWFTRNAVEEDETDSPRVVTREVETAGVSLDNRAHLTLWPGAEAVLTYGGEVYADEQTGTDNTSPDGARGGVPDAETRFYAAFAQAELTLDRPLGLPGALTVIPGLRWDRFENEAVNETPTEDEAVSPKLGVSWKPLPPLMLFGSWARAFRAPSVNEIYADGMHFQIPDLSATPPFPPVFVTNVFIANPDLVPEESETWEAGAGVDFADVLFRDDRFTAKGSYYRSSVTNLIDLEVNIPAGCFGAPFPPCGSGEAFGNFSRHVNVTNARIEGFELEAFYDAPFLWARAAFSAIDGRNADTDEFVGALAPDTLFLDAGVKLPRIAMRLGARLRIASRFDEVNDPALARDGFAVGDIYAVWEPEDGPLAGLRVDLGADNVTDADYEVVAAGVSQPGLNLKAAVSWRRAF